jgi:hypothetical protein
MDPAQAAIRDLEALEARFDAVCATAPTAGSPHGPWRLANSPALAIAFPAAYFDALGLPRLLAVALAQPN